MAHDSLMCQRPGQGQASHGVPNPRGFVFRSRDHTQPVPAEFRIADRALMFERRCQRQWEIALVQSGEEAFRQKLIGRMLAQESPAPSLRYGNFLPRRAPALESFFPILILIR